MLEHIMVGSRLTIAAVFALAAIEKFTSIATRTTKWHPIMLVGSHRRRYALLLMSSALLADTAAIFCLLNAPRLGAALAALLLLSYSAAGLGHQANSGTTCRCLWRILNSRTSTGMLARNGTLFILDVLVVLSSRSAQIIDAFVAGTLLLIVAWAVRAGDRLRAGELGGDPFAVWWSDHFERTELLENPGGER